MASVIKQADLARKPVALGVLKLNPAIALYRRLGFRVVADDQYKYYLQRPASEPGSTWL